MNRWFDRWVIPKPWPARQWFWFFVNKLLTWLISWVGPGLWSCLLLGSQSCVHSRFYLSTNIRFIQLHCTDSPIWESLERGNSLLKLLCSSNRFHLNFIFFLTCVNAFAIGIVLQRGLIFRFGFCQLSKNWAEHVWRWM